MSDPRTCWGRVLLETGIVVLVIMDAIAIIPALSSNRNPNWELYGLGKVGPLSLHCLARAPEPCQGLIGVGRYLRVTPSSVFAIGGAE